MLVMLVITNMLSCIQLDVVGFFYFMKAALNIVWHSRAAPCVPGDTEGRTPCSAQGSVEGWDPGTERRLKGVWVEKFG